MDPNGYAAHLPLGDKNIFKVSKTEKTYKFLDVQYTVTKTINGKSINWTPTGYATHLPSGDKTFSRFKNLKKTNRFLKVQYTFPKTK